LNISATNKPIFVGNPR